MRELYSIAITHRGIVRSDSLIDRDQGFAARNKRQECPQSRLVRLDQFLDRRGAGYLDVNFAAPYRITQYMAKHQYSHHTLCSSYYIVYVGLTECHPRKCARLAESAKRISWFTRQALLGRLICFMQHLRDMFYFDSVLQSSLKANHARRATRRHNIRTSLFNCSGLPREDLF